MNYIIQQGLKYPIFTCGTILTGYFSGYWLGKMYERHKLGFK